MSNLYKKIDDMTWPKPGERMGEIDRSLLQACNPNGDTLAAAASIIAAYRGLVTCSQKKRNYIVAQLRESEFGCIDSVLED